MIINFLFDIVKNIEITKQNIKYYIVIYIVYLFYMYSF